MYTLTIYTHPWCTDCQLAKEELQHNNISYKEYNLTENPEKEEELKEITGSRVVPGFVFYKKSFLQKFTKPVVFTGYEKNKEEIWQYVKK